MKWVWSVSSINTFHSNMLSNLTTFVKGFLPSFPDPLNLIIVMQDQGHVTLPRLYRHLHKGKNREI